MGILSYTTLRWHNRDTIDDTMRTTTDVTYTNKVHTMINNGTDGGEQLVDYNKVWVFLHWVTVSLVTGLFVL